MVKPQERGFYQNKGQNKGPWDEIVQEDIFGLQRTSGYGFLKILRVFFSFKVFKNYKTQTSGFHEITKKESAVL